MPSMAAVVALAEGGAGEGREWAALFRSLNEPNGGVKDWISSAAAADATGSDARRDDEQARSSCD